MQTTDTSPPAATKTQHRFLFAAVLGVSVLIAAWSSPGLAAARQGVQSADSDTPAIELVDLSDVSGSGEDSDNLTQSVAPLLFLTPRVASILEDVFGDSDREKPAARADQEAPTAELENAAIEQAKPATPAVVDNAGGSRLEQPASPMYEHAAILPRFQRQMYRTDI